MDYIAYQPYSRLVGITVMGRKFHVPENNVLLRCFQFLEPRLPYGPWCWNGDCGSDRVLYREPGELTTHVGLCCQLVVREGMEIVEITPELRRALATVLSPEEQPVPVAGA